MKKIILTMLVLMASLVTYTSAADTCTTTSIERRDKPGTFVCCPDPQNGGTVGLYGQYGYTKCCEGNPYGQTADNAGKPTLAMCCATPNKLYMNSDGEGDCADINKCYSMFKTLDGLYKKTSKDDKLTQVNLKGLYGLAGDTWTNLEKAKTTHTKYRDNGCEGFSDEDYNKLAGSKPQGTYQGIGTPDNMGIQCSQADLLIGQCKLDVYGTLGIRQNSENSVGVFVQDIILAATMFIGTVVTIAIVVSGLMFVFAGADSGLKEKAMKGLKNSIIGLLIVLSSYAIIRLVQFIVKGD